MGDFNINLLKSETHAGISFFYNTMLSNLFSPYILQPTRPVSKSLIDNICFDTIDYPSKFGNLKIQLADHPYDLLSLKISFSHLSERNIILKKEISNTLMRENSRKLLMALIYIYNVLQLNKNDPNFSLENIHNHVKFILDEKIK